MRRRRWKPLPLPVMQHLSSFVQVSLSPPEDLRRGNAAQMLAGKKKKKPLQTQPFKNYSRLYCQYLMSQQTQAAVKGEGRARRKPVNKMVMISDARTADQRFTSNICAVSPGGGEFSFTVFLPGQRTE